MRSPISTMRPPTMSGLTCEECVNISAVSLSQRTSCLDTHLGDDLELLALAVLGLGDGLLEARDGLVVKLLQGGIIC